MSPEQRGQPGSEEGVCTDIDKKNDLHEDASTTKIIKKTLVSVPQDGVRPNNALPSCAMKDKEVEESRNTKDSVYASLTQSKEEL